MPPTPADRQLRADLLAALALIPQGRVASVDLIAAKVRAPLPTVLRLLAELTEDERQLVPWHRAVRRGGAIGWGPHREAHFARLLREGIPVSPAGIVQDMPRNALSSFEPKETPKPAASQPDSQPSAVPRWRGFRDRPT